MPIDGDVIDEALERFGTTGPEFGGGLSNHGPMAADALIALGRPDAVVGWSEWYAQRLTEHPQPRNPIVAADWREALGDIKRAGDWIAFFDTELRERSWTDVLDTWVAGLAPGIMAGATHGILRTAHAVRSIDAAKAPSACTNWPKASATGPPVTRRCPANSPTTACSRRLQRSRPSRGLRRRRGAAA